ncbi:MAG TPA: [protein-PII] uridylyltransferase [Acidimicrobiales bacterium]|jgi:[protein-PII] uridylyltransferase|nr:[protein-PII] uridylyltransferase [Acidimicrobiales bacterium]
MTIAAARAQLAADDTLVGRALCAAWTAAVDRWLAGLVDDALAGGDPRGVALAAVGGYGRGELSLQSDVDVVLLHAGRDDVGELADRIWYPVWDARLKLGHAVRTVSEALALAADDLDTATSLLQVRHLAGDPALTAELAAKAELRWRKRPRRQLAALAARVRERHRRVGEVAFLLEPDLKEGRGGLRDVHALDWAQAARTILWETDEAALRAAYDTLLAVRVELHRQTGRPGDQLLLQEQDGVAAALGYEDADALMRAVAAAARTIAWTSDDAWSRIESSLAGPLGRVRRSHDLGGGLRLRDGEVAIADAAAVAGDPALALRAAAAAASRRTRLERRSLDRLAAEAPAPPEPWDPATRGALVELLAAGPPAVPLLEALDQQGVWERYLPEWASVRSRPQRNALHRYTVDRHLWEAAAGAAALAGRVARPDLLLVGALLHDIGKGQPGDHTEAGVELIGRIAPRMGFDERDVEVLVTLCRLHLLLPAVATRRDIDDPATIDAVAEAVGSREVLELLAALTEADARATGPAAWTEWRAGLVRALVARVDHVLGGGDARAVAEPFPTPAQRELLAAGRTSVTTDDDRLTVVAPDRPGLFSRVAGVLALHGLDVVEAAAASEGGWAVEVFRVQSSFGPTFSWDRVVADVDRALTGRLAVGARLAERARTYGRRRSVVPVGDPEVRFDLDASEDATVVEVHAADAVGLLHRVTSALADLDLDIVRAKVQTLGPRVVDAFSVRSPLGGKVTDPAVLAEVERALLHALAEV